MGADTDDFITATFALWAGDFEYAESLLKRYSNSPSLDGSIESPEELIQRTGALRLRQLRQKKGEFKLLAAVHDFRNPITPNPPVLETKHLRGAIWRLGTREFNLRAYLTDLSWEENLVQLAKSEATQHEWAETPIDQRDSALGFQDDQKVKTNLGVAWTVTGRLLLRAQLSDLCLLDVNGTWTEAQLPNTDEEIKRPFLQLLYALDPDVVSKVSETRHQPQ